MVIIQTEYGEIRLDVIYHTTKRMKLGIRAPRSMDVVREELLH